MPRFIDRLVWAIRISMRNFSGRWYIFRDAPDWVCAEWARYEDDPDDDLRSVAQQAIEELQLRISNLRRDIERAAADADAYPSTTHLTKDNP